MDEVVEVLEKILYKLDDIENRLIDIEMGQIKSALYDIDDIYNKLDDIESSINNIG